MKKWLGAACAALGLVSGQARADEACQQLDENKTPYSVCFDPGHRLYLSGGTDGGGVGVQLRTTVRTDEPGTHWRLEQSIARASTATERFRGAVYEGRFLRHSREGYLLLPGSPPRRLSVPFDVGLETSFGRVEGRWDQDLVRVGAVRGALLADVARSETFRRRAALGVVARWDMIADRKQRAIVEQSVAPFTVGYLSLYAESRDGLWLFGLSGEAGYATLGSKGGWRRRLGAEATLERVLVAFNDAPLSLYLSGRIDDNGRDDVPGHGLRGEAGLRVAVFSRRRIE